MENLIYFAVCVLAWWIIELSWFCWFKKETAMGQVLWSVKKFKYAVIGCVVIAAVIEGTAYWFSFTGTWSPWIGVGIWAYNFISMLGSTWYSRHIEKEYGKDE